MAINRRERFSVLESEITKSIETLKEAIRLDKDLQEAKEKRQYLFVLLKNRGNALKEVELMAEQRPTDVMKKYQTALESELNEIQCQLNMNSLEISTIGRELDENGLSHCTESLAAQIREAIGLVNDGEMLEVEKMYQQSQNQIRVLEEENRRLKSKNEKVKAGMEIIRDQIGKISSRLGDVN